ncbi:MAG: AtpZ/AtpI family protein [Jatrophihabitantaceae bacterium]
MGKDGSNGLTWSNLLSIGTVSALILVAGLALGWWIDSLLHTSPIFVLVGIAVGIASGIGYTVVQFRSFLKELGRVSTLQSAYNVPVDAATNLRRSSIVAGCLGVVGIVVCALVGHPWMGVFACVGLALGALNNLMLQRSVRQYAFGEAITKKSFRHGVFARLGAVTLLALGAGLIVRPDGLGVFAGLAVFQVVMLVGAAVPVFRSMRSPS